MVPRHGAPKAADNYVKSQVDYKNVFSHETCEKNDVKKVSKESVLYRGTGLWARPGALVLHSVFSVINPKQPQIAARS